MCLKTVSVLSMNRYCICEKKFYDKTNQVNSTTRHSYKVFKILTSFHMKHERVPDVRRIISQTFLTRTNLTDLGNTEI